MATNHINHDITGMQNAALDLYIACKMAIAATGGSENWQGDTHTFLVAAEEAVAKAEGRQK